MILIILEACLSWSCLFCIQVLFAAILVHSVPPGSHLRSASSQVSAAAAICCSGQILQASVIEAIKDINGNLKLCKMLQKLFYLKLYRPLWVEFQREQRTFTVDNQYMIGDK